VAVCGSQFAVHCECTDKKPGAWSRELSGS
jgi:hypothetical protein